ncbi:hypothetical protein BaRGS_00032127 [Batillaria attramentaria]|uniref:Ankyrin repeat protein n=1 Tax=Batillaria attramentaria TaxID=370345 RepID=A0ABD0JP02_9CAEN
MSDDVSVPKRKREAADGNREADTDEEDFTSIHHKDVKALQTMLADPVKKTEINHRKTVDGEQLTPLELAVHKGSLEMVELLAAAGADVYTRDENEHTLLHRAVGCTDNCSYNFHDKTRAAIIKFLLSKGLDGNARDKDNKPPLFYAVLKGRNKCCRAFLRDKNIDQKAMKERFEIKDYINTPDADQTDRLTLLELAVLTCRAATVKFLVRKGSDIGTRNEKQQTLLHRAVGCSNYRCRVKDKTREGIIKFLLREGVDGNARDKDNKTPLFYAVIEGRNKCCRALLHDENLDKKIFEERFEIKDYMNDANESDRLTLLELAVLTCSVATVKLLVEKGSDISTKNEKQQTLMHRAVGCDDNYRFGFDDKRRVCIAEYLLSKNVGGNTRDKDKKTPLFYAVLKGRNRCCRQIVLVDETFDTMFLEDRFEIEYGVDLPGVTQRDQLTLLQMAAATCSLATVKLLVEKGSDVNSKSESMGFTPLHFAARADEDDDFTETGETEGVLKERYVSDDCEDPMTLLEHAVTRCNLDTVKLLVEKGADVNSRNESTGLTPLHIAVQAEEDDEFTDAGEERAKMIEFLLSVGADVNAKDKDNKIPLDWAVLKGKDKICNILLNRMKGDTGAVFKERYASDDHDNPMTLCEHANIRCSPDTVNQLREMGADVESKSEENATPLPIEASSSVQDDQEKVAECLVLKGAEPSSMDSHNLPPTDYAVLFDKDGNGNTALHLMVMKEYRNVKVAVELIEKGAKVDEPNGKRNTPIHLAVDNSELLRHMLQRPIRDINAVNVNQETALHLAAGSGAEDCVSLLLKK